MRLLPLTMVLLLPLVAFAPPAAAQATLADFEEPHVGAPEAGGVFAFTVTPEQAGEPHVLVYRNHPQRPFNLSVVAPDGTTVFAKAGTRGIQTLPPLEAGDYRFVIQRSRGEFQVTSVDRALPGAAPVDATLEGEADAYVLFAKARYNVTFSGNVTIELFDLQSSPKDLPANTTLLVERGQALVFTVRGEPGTPYSVDVETLPEEEDDNDTPGLPPVLVLGAVLAALGLGRLRRRRRI